MNKDFLNSRYAAYLIFSNIISKKIFIEEALSLKEFLQLNKQDKAFTRNLVSTAFRVKFKIEYILNNFINCNTEVNIKILLSLAMAEIIALKTPDYAVVNSYVELTKQLGFSKLTGFINAVLKKACREYKSILNKYSNQNNWLFKLWSKDYTKDIAFKISKALEERNPIDIIFKDKKYLDEHKDIGINLFANLLRCESSVTIPELNGYKEGYFWVQGASSFLSLYLLKDFINNKNVVDLCSAPGGKSFLMSILGAKNIKSFDLSAKRIVIMKDNLERLKLIDKIDIQEKNILDLNEKDLKEIDVLVLDVPCLATGTIRKHPEILFLKTESQLRDINKIQCDMLNNISKNMQVGSILLYSNCSLQKQEGEYLINDFLKNNDDFIILPIKEEEIFNHKEMITKEGYLRILPYHLSERGGMEGFFAVRLKKIK